MTDPTAPVADVDLPWDALRAKAMQQLRLQTTLQDRFMNLGTAAWAVDLAAGTITFTSEQQRAVAPVQVVGSLNPEDGTWLWGWDHPSVPEPLAEHARAVHAYGEQHGLERLTTRLIPATADEAWEFAAVADLLGGGQCAYRGPAGSAVVFMTFGNPTLAAVDGEPTEPALAESESAEPEPTDAEPSEPRAAEWATDAPAVATDAPAAEPVPPPGLTLIPAPGLVAPRLRFPDGIPAPETVDSMSGPAPEFSADQAVGVVQSFMRQMRPLYFADDPAALAEAEVEQRCTGQKLLRQVFWRRTDDAHRDCVLAADTDYDLSVITDWDARQVGERHWQVTYQRPTAQDEVRGEGYLVMLFHDAPQLVDTIEDQA